MNSDPAHRYDVIIFDSVGMPYTGSTPQHSGLGGSEFEAILLAEALARRGFSVLVLNRTLLPAHEGGVRYANNEAVLQWAFECKTLILARYSHLPPVHFERLLVWVSDVPGKPHEHLFHHFASGIDATLVALSQWHRSLFPPAWNAAVVPYILPERVYAHRAPFDHRRFVYASAALKGLGDTIDIWRDLKRDPALADAELVVCTPGYDAVDEAALAGAGVRFLGNLPFDRVVEEIAASAGLFYVNTFPETFCIVVALAEALERRVHVLCRKGAGALHETANSPLVTSNRDEFMSAFRSAYASPGDPRWIARPNDYHEGTVIEHWLRLLRPDEDASGRVPRVSGRAPTLCLNMIVKNEAHVIERCLASVKPIVSSWVIVDTGSTDGTQQVVRRLMEGIPGELHERPWRDFGHNRTEAIQLARGKADYLLVVDADDVIDVGPAFDPAALTQDVYELRVEDLGQIYYRNHIFRADHGFHYVGVLHEVLMPPEGATSVSKGRAEGLVYRRLGGGGRSAEPGKFARDAAVLEKALADDPTNPRYAFYLAQSWKDAGELEKAVEMYERRAKMDGWVEETWASLMAIAQLSARLERSDDAVIAAYLRAYENRPSRAEPLCYAATLCRLKNRYALAHLFATTAVGIARPQDLIWTDESVYTWRALDEYAIASYYVGRHTEAIAANEKLLASPHLPESERERVKQNMAFSTAIVGKR